MRHAGRAWTEARSSALRCLVPARPPRQPTRGSGPGAAGARLALCLHLLEHDVVGARLAVRDAVGGEYAEANVVGVGELLRVHVEVAARRADGERRPRVPFVGARLNDVAPVVIAGTTLGARGTLPRQLPLPGLVASGSALLPLRGLQLEVLGRRSGILADVKARDRLAVELQLDPC